MKGPFIKLAGLLAAVSLSACATVPTASYAPVMPAPYKPFDVYAQDQQTCRAFASSQVSGQAEAANQRAVAGALLGAALGAGIGAAAGNGRDAALGAATGALAGTAIGASSSTAAGYNIQRQYDIAYQQCMYARGNQVPGAQAPGTPPPPPPPGGRYAPSPGASSYPPPNYPPPNYPPPNYPPPNYPPPSGAYTPPPAP